MKNKKILLTLISILIVIILAIVVFFVVRYFNSSKGESYDEIDLNTINNGYGDTLPTVNIQSTTENPIEMDDVEASNIKIINNYGELQVSTTLKNNSNETLSGFFIELSLLDENGNTVTNISLNSDESIEPNQELTISNNVAGLEPELNISSAKILSIEKNTIQENIENAFDEMEQSIQHPTN